MRPLRKRRSWSLLPDDELLELRLCDLRLRIEGSPVEPELRRLYRELAARGIGFEPHCWIAQEWFSPDGVPGIAIPFYLLHPRLRALERRFMGKVEGGNARSLMRILRHEAGHAIDTAYRLRRRRRWREIFGPASQPYPRHYRPRPGSRHYVQHLGGWYAQSHPTEDFAETVAVWLAPRSAWRRRYAGWPALRKLQYVDALMAEIAGRPPVVRARRHVEPIRIARRTLRQHYAHMVSRYRSETTARIDAALRRVFGARRGRSGPLAAVRLMRKELPRLQRLPALPRGASPYLVQEIVERLIDRAAALDLRVRGERRLGRRRIERLVLAMARRAMRGSGSRIAL